MANFKKPFNPVYLPWFMFDMYNLQLITTLTIPSSDISDTKDIVLTETPIPGLSFNPINQGGFGNRKVSFTIPLVKRNNTVGNILILKQFENLRNQAFGINPTNIFRPATQFTPNPKVLFFWGTGSGVPLEWYVKKCDPVHKSQFINRFGYPQYSEISIELWLDETSLLYKAEETFRKISSYLGQVQSAFDIAQGIKGEGVF
jgi:hypothetical protein